MRTVLVTQDDSGKWSVHIVSRDGSKTSPTHKFAIWQDAALWVQGELHRQAKFGD